MADVKRIMVNGITNKIPIKPVMNTCPSIKMEKMNRYTAKNTSHATAPGNLPSAFCDSELKVFGVGEIKIFQNVVNQSVRVSLNVIVDSVMKESRE